MSQPSRRAEALQLAEQLLNDIELSNLVPIDIARRTSRLARMLDDGPAIQWLSFEVVGYPTPLTAEATLAARRSRRLVLRDEGGESEQFNVGTLGQISGLVAGANARMAIQSASPVERNEAQKLVLGFQLVLDNVVGSMHGYVAEQYQELRFGSAVESAFEIVRREVDAAIGSLVPDALPMLSSAFENATSSNPEDWANAASTCRRLLKAVADAVRPPGGAVRGRSMGDGNYVNRLVDWIVTHSDSETLAGMVTSDLEYLGKRLDAADGAGHKGAHATVSRFDASRFISGTYLMIGDILRLEGSASTS